MSCNSAIYTVNATNSEVNTEAGTYVQVPFGSIVRRFGRSIGCDGYSILLFSPGYYECSGSITVTPTAAGPVTVRVAQDGQPVPGLMATDTGTAGEPLNLALEGLIRNCKCDCNAQLTLWIDAPCALTNVPIVVKKI